MSAWSDSYNALPDDQRFMLNALMIEAEIRFVELEKKRIVSEARKAITEHNNRIYRMRQHLDRITSGAES